MLRQQTIVSEEPSDKVSYDKKRNSKKIKSVRNRSHSRDDRTRFRTDCTRPARIPVSSNSETIFCFSNK